MYEYSGAFDLIMSLNTCLKLVNLIYKGVCLLEVESKTNSKIMQNLQHIVYYLSAFKYTRHVHEDGKDEFDKIKEKIFKKLVCWIDDELSDTDPSQSYDPFTSPDFFDSINVS